jgi:hypothetical protein
MKVTKTFLLIAVACMLTGKGEARPVTLTCNSSVNLYAQPYSVVVNSKALTIQIIDASGPLAGRRLYRISNADNASDGGYTVTASGRLQSQIQVMVSPDEKWIEYLDAFTNRPYAVDYCS